MEVLSRYFPGGSDSNHTNYVRIVNVTAEIWNEYPQIQFQSIGITLFTKFKCTYLIIILIRSNVVGI
jgi:hypothetical protein